MKRQATVCDISTERSISLKRLSVNPYPWNKYVANVVTMTTCIHKPLEESLYNNSTIYCIGKRKKSIRAVGNWNEPKSKRGHSGMLKYETIFERSAGEAIPYAFPIYLTLI